MFNEHKNIILKKNKQKPYLAELHTLNIGHPKASFPLSTCTQIFLQI